MDEDERVSLIAKLEKRKHEIWKQIQSLPVCNRSHAVELKEKELFRNLDEVSMQASMLLNNRIFVT